MSKFISLAVVFLHFGGALTAQQDAARVLLAVDFEHGFQAQAAGRPDPLNRNLPELTAGMHGRAARFGPGQALEYATEGNFSAQRGALAVWVQSPVEGDRAAPDRYTILASPENQAIRVFLGSRGGLRADVGDEPLLRVLAGPSGSGGWFLPERIEWWRKGEWRHLVVNWDAASGELYAFVNGAGMPAWVARWDAKSFTKAPWQATRASTFIIGASSAAGDGSWRAALDDIRIFDRPLTPTEAQAEFLRHGRFRVEVHTLDAFLFAGRRERCRLVFQNNTARSVVLQPSFDLVDDRGNRVASGKLETVRAGAGGRATISVPIALPAPGDYRAILRFTEGAHKEQRELKLAAVALVEPVNRNQNKEHFLTEIDATLQSSMIESAPSRIVSSALGSYREAGPKRNDRFLLPFETPDVGRPHLAVIRYPDDKARTMEVIVQQLTPPGDMGDYQAQTGVFTGAGSALSNRMLEHRVLFWPTAPRMGLIFMTVEAQRPAAVASVRVFRLDSGLEKFDVAPYRDRTPGRHVGIYYEDPSLASNFSARPILTGFGKAADSLLGYMDWIGLDTLTYPIAFYRGPLYGSDREPGDADISTRPHVYDYPRYLMKRLHARGMKFNAGMSIHDLPSLAPHVILDERRVLGGEETAINVRADNRLHYTGSHSVDTNYNPLDPNVQAGVKRVVAEIAGRYGDEPAFTGITLVLARHKLFSFGSIESGYNDINLRRFQQETGVRIPVDPRDAKRFSRSYEWLMKNARGEWVAWRCRKIHEYYRELADILTARRADLKLTVGMFAHPYLYHARLAQYAGSKDILAETLGEAGIDPNLFANDRNVVIGWTMAPADHRFFGARKDGHATPEEHRTAYIAPEITAHLRKAVGGAAAILHDRYFENDIGRTQPMKGLGVAEVGWRASTLNAAWPHSMEMVAAAVNNFDALEVTKGGYLIGTYGMEDELRRFAAAFRALPAVPFEDVPGMEDPVRVRQKIVDGKSFFYVLNRGSDASRSQLAVDAGGASPRTGGRHVSRGSRPSAEAQTGALRTAELCLGTVGAGYLRRAGGYPGRIRCGTGAGVATGRGPGRTVPTR